MKLSCHPNAPSCNTTQPPFFYETPTTRTFSKRGDDSVKILLPSSSFFVCPFVISFSLPLCPPPLAIKLEWPWMERGREREREREREKKGTARAFCVRGGRRRKGAFGCSSSCGGGGVGVGGKGTIKGVASMCQKRIVFIVPKRV